MKPITEQEALQKLASLCSQAEHCTGEMEEKMIRWGLDNNARQRITDYLVREKYVDDTRFCRFFIHDKIRYNGWGRRKIEQALYKKHIPKHVSDEAFAEIDDSEYIIVLRHLMQQKRKTTKAKNDYERNMKLIRFAMSRGFTMDIIRECIDCDAEYDED